MSQSHLLARFFLTAVLTTSLNAPLQGQQAGSPPSLSDAAASCGPLRILQSGGNVTIDWGFSPCRLQAASSLAGPIPWSDVDGASSPYAVPAIGARYFRTVSADGNSCSPNIVGYVRVRLVRGDNLIASPFNGTNNQLNTILPLANDDSQDGVMILRFDTTTQGFANSAHWFGETGWVDDSFDVYTLPLNPGEGFFFRNTLQAAIDVTFVGEVPQGALHNAIPGGGKYSLRSSQVPQSGRLADLGFPAVDGDRVSLWDAAAQAYQQPDTYVAGSGWFTSDFTPIPGGPTIPVAGGFLVQKAGAASQSWDRAYSVACGPAPTPTITGQVGITNYLYETNESYLLCIPLGPNYRWSAEEDWSYTDPGSTNVSDKVYLRNTTNGAAIYFGSDDESGNIPSPSTAGAGTRSIQLSNAPNWSITNAICMTTQEVAVRICVFSDGDPPADNGISDWIAVQIGPLITVQPENLTVNASSNATFSVTATGTGPLRFQWRFNGTDIPGATNPTLTIPNAQRANAGSFDVIVANEAGEVLSDAAVLTVQEFDFGDAPAVYPTKLADNGARHKLKRLPDGFLLTLGFVVDGEPDGQPDATATGDDNANVADEDGVTFSTPLVQGQQATISVWSSHDAKIDAWVDFNGNNSWADAGEKIFDNQAVKDSFANGPNQLNFNVPIGAKVGNTFVRFRLSTAGGLNFTGEAANGEVEDYSVFIRQAPAANVAVRGPYVFKNTSGFDASSLQVIFAGTGGQLVNPCITMEPEDANGTPTLPGAVGSRNTVTTTWVNKIRKGGLIAFSVQCPGAIQVNSAQWSDGVNTVAVNLHANLDSAQPIPGAPVDLRFRTRKSYKDYRAADLDLLIEAMLLLHDPAKAPPRDAKRPLQPGDPHDRYEEYVQAHDINQGTAHGGSHFTPWHRKLLLDFENDLRSLDPKYKDVTVPFWDWTLADNDPFTDFLGGNGAANDRNRVQGGAFGKTMNQWRTYAFQNSNKNWQRGYLKRQYRDAKFNDSTLKRLGPGARTAALNEGDYAKFRFIWETGVVDPLVPVAQQRTQFGTHNDAHVWVGGDLGIPTRGVNEPGFWLLHSFIDETWAEWQCKYGVDTFKKFPGTQGADDPMKGFPGNPPPAAKTMFNFLTLGFTYERPAGTRIDDPKNCRVPRLLRLLIDMVNQQTLRVSAENGVGFYQLLASADLANWGSVQTLLASNTVNDLLDIPVSSDPHRFFSIRRLVGGPSGSQFVINSFSTFAQGQISPAGLTVVNGGDAVSFTVTPAPGFAVDSWYVDGAIVQTGGSVLTLTNVQADHTVSAGYYDLSASNADLSVVMTASVSTAPHGQPVTYTIFVNNAGPQTASSILVQFEPPHMSELSSVNASQGDWELMGDPPEVHHVTFSVGSLGPGSHAILTLVFAHHEAGPATSTVWANSPERDANLSNNEASTTVTILP